MEAILLFLALGLVPVYSFASGGIQISHVLLALLIGMRLTRVNWHMVSAEAFLVTLFTLILIREACAVFIESVQVSSLIEVLYIAFALLVVLTFSRLPLDRKLFMRALVFGLVASAAVSWFGIWYFGATFVIEDGSMVRSVGTFNNPNQLGYYAVCCLSIASLLYLTDEIKRPLYVAFVASSLGLAMASLSKAGMLSVIFGSLLAVAAMLNRKRSSGKLIAACLLLSGVGFQLYNSGMLNDFSFVQRLQKTGSDSDDNFAERGYRSPLDNGALPFMFGLGEQKVTAMVGHEVHSSFWSYLMKYGVVGLGLFLAFWYSWTKQIWARFGTLGVLLIVAPASFYGITHNGSRFAIFWVLVGLSFAVTAPEKLRMPRKARPRAPAYPNLAAVNWQANPHA